MYIYIYIYIYNIYIYIYIYMYVYIQSDNTCMVFIPRKITFLTFIPVILWIRRVT